MSRTTKIESVRHIVNSDAVKVGDLTFTNNVKRLNQHGSFGDVIEFDMPEGASCVVLAYNKGTGIHPFTLCLTHQVYIHKIEKLLKDVPGVKTITVIPVRSEDYIDILMQ